MAMWILLFVLLLPLLLLGLWVFYYQWFWRWYDKNTRGDRFFALTSTQKQAFEHKLYRLGSLLLPVLQQLARHSATRPPPSIDYQGFTFPSATTTSQSIDAALQYLPSRVDIFVVTQMKSGTSWLQQLVFETLFQGKGDLSDTGYRHMYAISPWLETGSCASVAMENAPLLSDDRRRLIKTHLPASLCPFNPNARYIYLMRHPVDCFASTEDFLQMLMGPFCPSEQTLLDWFCSHRMWWGDWPAHVSGWWQLAQDNPNVLFLDYKALKDDLPGCVKKISEFIDVPLSTEELEQVVAKGGLAYMKQHQEQFSMAPPTLFSVREKQHFIGNHRKPMARHQKVISEYCATRLADSDFPLTDFYPDIAEAGKIRQT